MVAYCFFLLFRASVRARSLHLPLVSGVFVQVACMSHQWWLTEAKLAIVFTYFFLFLPFFLFLRLLLPPPEAEIPPPPQN